MNPTPYSPPRAELELPAESVHSAKAHLSDPKNRVLGRRFVATLIDYVVCASILLIPDAVLGNSRYRETLWVWLLLLAAYFPLMEGLTGYSVGKFIARAKVVDDHGNVPGIWRAAIRTVFRLLEVNPFLLGGVPAGLTANFSKSGQRLGDMAAGTYVVASSAVRDIRREP
ncbi:MAG: RDD family protein [Rhizobacter sp.]|nr:RDD family protein [Rhizobacter sp.]